MPNFNTVVNWGSCSAEQRAELLMRPAISASDSITRTVREILDNVKANGDSALREYSAKFDKTEVAALRVSALGRGAFRTRRSLTVRTGGEYGSENAGISSEKDGENPSHRKPKVS